MNEQITDDVKAVLGTLTTAGGAIASWQTQLEWALRVGASIGAIIVAALTAWSILRKMKSKRQEAE